MVPKSNKKTLWKPKALAVLENGLFFMATYCLYSYLIGETDYTIAELLFQSTFFGLFMGIGYPYLLGKIGIKFVSNKTKKQ